MLDKLQRSTTTLCASVCVLLIVLCVSHVRTDLQLCNRGWMVNVALLYGHLLEPLYFANTLVISQLEGGHTQSPKTTGRTQSMAHRAGPVAPRVSFQVRKQVFEPGAFPRFIFAP